MHRGLRVAEGLGAVHPFHHYGTAATGSKRRLWPALLWAATIASACGDDAGSDTNTNIAVVVASQDRIASENGELELLEGQLSISSITLVGEDGESPLIGPVVADLAEAEQELPLRAAIQAGDYTGLRVRLEPPGEGGQTLDVRVRTLDGANTVRVTSALMITGSVGFPEGSRSVVEGSSAELVVTLTGMFFYLSPVTSAVDGHWQAGEEARDFLSMDLVGMFDLRVQP